MPTYKVGNNTITLSDKDYISSGHQGSVYGKGDLVYKVYIGNGIPLTENKFKELSILTKDNIINPLDLIYEKNSLNGYTMRWVRDATPIVRLFSNAYQKNNNIDENKITELVQCIQETIEFIHEKDITIVDANEFNFLVPENSNPDTVYFIDVDSYQTKTHPATAIKPTIQDFTTNSFNKLTDWYSFGVITFQLFTGIHPYKGKHPNYSKIDTQKRCIDHVSVFNNSVKLNSSVRSFDLIPSEYRKWYEEIFEGGKRKLPPNTVGTFTVSKPIYKRIQGFNKFKIEKILEFNEDIINHRCINGIHHVFGSSRVTEDVVLINGIEIYIVDNGSISNKVILEVDPPHQLLRKEMEGRAICFNNELFIYNNGRITTCNVRKLSNSKILITKDKGWDIPRKSTKLFNGTILSNYLGKIHQVNPHLDRCFIAYLKELDNTKIIDAKRISNVNMILFSDGDEEKVLCTSLSNDGELRGITLDTTSLNFTVLDNGMILHIIEDGILQIMYTNKDNIIKIDDPSIRLDTQLSSDGTKVYLIDNNILYKFESV